MGKRDIYNVIDFDLLQLTSRISITSSSSPGKNLSTDDDIISRLMPKPFLS